MRVKPLLWSLFLLLSYSPMVGQNSLTVIHPQDPWWYQDGRIQEVTMTVQPQGQYVEVGTYLTIDCPYNWYAESDSLEIIYNFALPNGAILNDSWLWVEDEIVRAFLWDFWTANEVYEGFVNRSTDPSFLYETGPNTYQLRIFPLLGEESRQVKINYLLPIEYWNGDLARVGLSLPQLFSTVYYPTESFRLLVYPQQGWTDFGFVEHPSWEGEWIMDPLFGNVLEFPASPDVFNATLTFAAKAPMENGLMVGRYQVGDEQYYQVTLNPEFYLDFEEDKQYLLLIDHWEGNSDFLYYTLWDGLRNHLVDYLGPEDEFNVLLRQGNAIESAFLDWNSATDDNIQSYFDGINPMSFYGGGDFQDFLTVGLQWAADYGENTEILLITNSDGLHEFEDATAALDALAAVNQLQTPIHIFDYQNDFYQAGDFIGGQWYYGNDYFYQLLSSAYGGEYVNLQHGAYSWAQNMTIYFESLDDIDGLAELDVDPTDGFTYQSYQVDPSALSGKVNTPRMQIGKYYGAFPMDLAYQMVTDEGYFEIELQVDESQVIELDSVAEESWAGNFIRDLESQGQHADLILQIIDKSKQYRVLSSVTAFIALDPAVGGEPCYECLNPGDDIIISSSEVKEEPKVLLRAYPNPFTEQLTIDLQSEQVTAIQIYSTQGQLVWQKEIAGTALEEQIFWNGKNFSGQDVPNGWYIIVIHLADGSHHLEKVVLQR